MNYRTLVASLALHALLPMPAFAQTDEALKKKQNDFELFRGLILKQDLNCPQVAAMMSEKSGAYGDVFLVFCGAKGIKPAHDDVKTGRVWGFRVTVSPTGRVTVAPLNLQ